MRLFTLLAATVTLTVVAPSVSLAQFPGVKGIIPGVGGSKVKGVDPDKFLADTIETTKFVMISAAILSNAASEAPDKAALAAKLKSINEAKDVKELDAHRVQMDEDIKAINDNKNLSKNVKANMATADARQKSQIAVAVFNFSLGAYRNVKLAQEAPQVVDAIKANPMLAMKAGKLIIAAKLVADEAKQTAGMLNSLHVIMSAGHIAEPKPAETTKPQPTDLGD